MVIIVRVRIYHIWRAGEHTAHAERSDRRSGACTVVVVVVVRNPRRVPRACRPGPRDESEATTAVWARVCACVCVLRVCADSQCARRHLGATQNTVHTAPGQKRRKRARAYGEQTHIIQRYTRRRAGYGAGSPDRAESCARASAWQGERRRPARNHQHRRQHRRPAAAAGPALGAASQRLHLGSSIGITSSTSSSVCVCVCVT